MNKEYDEKRDFQGRKMGYCTFISYIQRHYLDNYRPFQIGNHRPSSGVVWLLKRIKMNQNHTQQCNAGWRAAQILKDKGFVGLHIKVRCPGETKQKTPGPK